MAKKEQMTKLQKRDWIIVLLFIAIIATNWVWYQHSKAQEITNNSDTSAWLAHQVEINKLKHCIDSNMRPCDITPPRQ